MIRRFCVCSLRFCIVMLTLMPLLSRAADSIEMCIENTGLNENCMNQESADRSNTFLNIPGFELVASKDKLIGKAAMAYQYNTSLFTLGVSGPISDDDQSAGEFATLDGLTSNAKLELGFNKLLFDPVPLSAELEDFITTRAAARSAVEECSTSAEAMGKSEKEIRTVICKSEYAQLETTNSIKFEDNSANPLRKFGFLSLKASYSESTIKYFSLNDATSRKQDGENYEIKLAYGRINSVNESRWELGLAYQKGLEAGDDNKEKELCQALADNTGFQQCFKARLLKPLSKEGWVPSFNYTRIIRDNDLIKGYGVEIAHFVEDAERRADGTIEETDKWGFKVPVFLYRSGDDKYGAGVELAWNSEPEEDEDDVTLGFFFRSTIAIFR